MEVPDIGICVKPLQLNNSVPLIRDIMNMETSNVIASKVE